MTISNRNIVLVIITIIQRKKEASNTDKMIVDKMMIMIIDRIGDNLLIDNFMRIIDNKIIGIIGNNIMMMIIMMTIDIIKDLHNNKIVHNFILKVMFIETKILIKIHPQIINNNSFNNNRFKIIII